VAATFSGTPKKPLASLNRPLMICSRFSPLCAIDQSIGR